VFGLAPHRRFPSEAKPGEVLENRGFEFRTGPTLIDVFDT
jgi:hypothetical protein